MVIVVMLTLCMRTDSKVQSMVIAVVWHSIQSPSKSPWNNFDPA